MKRDSVVTLAVRAIDVGYFNVKYTLGRKADGDSSVIATGIFPSLAPILKTGDVALLQNAPAADGCKIDVQGVSYFVGKGAIHNSKGIEPRPVSEGYCLSDKYLALLRGALFYIAQDAGANEAVIECLMLGLPLNTYHAHHEALAARAQGEHVVASSTRGGVCRVTVKRVDVIVQPAGALVNFRVRHGASPDGASLVIDAGGGTLDWFLTQGGIPNLQRSGAYPKAMLACASAVADKINPKWRDQFSIVDRIDKAIREGASSFSVQGCAHSLADYRVDIEQVVEEALSKMFESIGTPDDIDQVLVTGGGAAVFWAQLLRSHPQLRNVVQVDTDPVFSNVRGFQVVGESLRSSRLEPR